MYIVYMYTIILCTSHEMFSYNIIYVAPKLVCTRTCVIKTGIKWRMIVLIICVPMFNFLTALYLIIDCRGNHVECNI